MQAAAFPVVLCTGIIRSGSTWSFNVCRHLVELAARRQGWQSSSRYMSEAVLEQWVAEGNGRPAGAVVVKAHEVGPRAVAALRAGAVRAVCTIRDPRDCVVSDVAFNRGQVEPSLRRVLSNLSYLSAYPRSGHTLFVRYEDMVAHPLRQVARVARHLGVDADDVELGRIDAMTGTQSARATAAGLRHRRADQVMWCDGRRVDPTTHLHENHIRTGRAGNWRDDTSPTEQAELTAVLHPWLVELGYERPCGDGSAYA